VKFALPSFSFNSDSIVGLDIGSSSVKAVELAFKGKGKDFELTHLGTAKLPSESIVQGAFLNSGAIVDTVREAIENGKIRTKNISAAVSGHSVIVKKVNLPSMTRDELDEQIRWEAEQYIPFDVNEVNLDFQILDSGEAGDGDGQMEVLCGRKRVRSQLRRFVGRDRRARQHRRASREHQHPLPRFARIHA
jgi:type IV pilus assembly protein PilM